MWEEPEIRAALAVRDIGEVYRALVARGVSQTRIATSTGQRQSDVSEVLKGRVVKGYRVLERIAEGLGIPREYMGPIRSTLVAAVSGAAVTATRRRGRVARRRAAPQARRR